MPISQLYILSLRGDALIGITYLDDVTDSSKEVFFRKVKDLTGDGEEAPPVFLVDGVTYLHVKTNQMYFVATCVDNESPSMVLELLTRICGLIKDVCGVLNEDSVRRNFVLVYELLSEVLDHGCVQTTAMESLKPFILNQPVAPPAAKQAKGGRMGKGMRTPIATQKSVMARPAGGRPGREEIFVDIVESLTLTFNAGGYVQHSEIDGTINMKSFLHGSPEIKIALNEDLSIGAQAEIGAFEGVGVCLDDCNFHDAVNLENFDLDRTLTLVAPEGEFAMMNYRSTYDFAPPFRVTLSTDDSSAAPHRVELVIKLRADYDPKFSAAGCTLRMPLPKGTVRVSRTLEDGAQGQSTDFKEKDRMLVWSFKKVPGGTEHLLSAKLTMAAADNFNARAQMGPISLEFSLPMYNASKLTVRYLHIQKGLGGRGKGVAEPHRWLRYVTNSRNYVVRVGER